MNTPDHFQDALDLITDDNNNTDIEQEVDRDLRKILNEINVKIGLPEVPATDNSPSTTFAGVLKDLEDSVKAFETPRALTREPSTAISSTDKSNSMLDVTPPLTPLPSAAELFKDIISKREKAIPQSRKTKRKREAKATAQLSTRGQPPPYPAEEPPAAEATESASPSKPGPRVTRASLQRKTFTNVTDFPTPFIPLDYVINVDVYPSRASGTLYEKYSKVTCARVDIEDQQVLKVFQLDEEKGIGLVARYVTSALTAPILLHNKIFNYVVDLDRIPISVRSYTGVVHRF